MVLNAPAGTLIGFGLALSGLFLLILAYGAARLETTDDAVSRTGDWPLAIALAATGTVILTGSLATSLAAFGVYSLNLLAVILALLAGAGWLALWRSNRNAAPNRRHARSLSWGGWHEVALLVILAIAAFLYLRPHEYVLGGNDPGTYVNTAAAVARTGSYTSHDELTALLRQFAPVTLREQPPTLQTRYIQTVGWYIDNTSPTTVYPQFFPFHPVLLAIATGLFGVAASLYVTPIWTVLGLAVFYLFGRKLFGKTVALLAVLLLAITPTHIFFARYPSTEPLTLLLLFTGMLVIQMMWEADSSPAWWGVMAGGAFGAALLTRIDLPVIIAILVLAVLVRLARRKWSAAWTWFVLVMCLYALQLGINVWLFNWPYFWNTYSSIFRLIGGGGTFTQGALLIAAGIGLTGLALILWRGDKLLDAGRRHELLIRRTLAGLIVVASIYAYFLRPIVEPGGYYESWPSGTMLLTTNGQNWVRIGWYLTPLGILLATLGVAQVLLRESYAKLWIVLAIALLTTVQYVYNILNSPYHIYAMRRYVPVIIPMLLLFAAYAAVNLPARWPARARSAVTVVCTVALVVGLLYQARFVLPQRDFAGSLDQLAALNAQLRPDALILFAEPSEAVFSDAFGPPLRYQFGHDVATVRSDTEQTDDFLRALLAWAQEREKPVQLLAVEPIPDHVRNTLSLRPFGSFSFLTDMLMNTFDDYPSVIQTIHYGIELYDVLPAESAGASEGTEVDIGTLDAAYIGEGFYGKEFIPGAPSMRWTKETASITLPVAPALATEGNGVPDLQVRAMIYRPDQVEPTAVTVRLDGAVTGEFTPTQEWQTYTFPITNTDVLSDGEVELEFAAHTFVPAEVGVNNDTRELGFLLDWVKIVPFESSN